MERPFEEFSNDTTPNVPPETGIERNPAPSVPPSSRKKGRGRMIFFSVALAFVFFMLGACTFWFSLDKGMRKLIWLKDRIDKDYYQDIPDDTFYSTLYGAINDDLLDSYSCYMTTDEFVANNQSMAGNRSGIGVYIRVNKEGEENYMRITRVVGNSPAEKAGVLDGDEIIGFGRTESSIVDSKVYDDYSAFSKTVDIGETFLVKVLRGEEERLLTITKELYLESYVSYRTATASYCFPQSEQGVTISETNNPLPSLPQNTGYIRLLQFSGKADEEFALAMEKWKADGNTNLVLDLRSNGGGYVDTMREISRYFPKNSKASKPLAIIADTGKSEKRYYACGNDYDKYFQEDSRICVLADRNTASASEGLLGFMLDYGAISYADICLIEQDGVAKTYGKGIMQTTFHLDWLEKDAVRLTTAELRWPVSKKSIHSRGILPEDGTKTVQETLEKDGEICAALAAFNLLA